MKGKVLGIVAVLSLVGCVPKSDLDAAQKQIAELQAQVQALKGELAKKPKLPVTMALRRAMLGPGYVAVFNTTIKSPVSVLATIKSKALSTTKKFELHLDPSTATELGYREGATIEAGDTITLENNNYSPVSFVVSP